MSEPKEMHVGCNTYTHYNENRYAPQLKLAEGNCKLSVYRTIPVTIENADDP